MTRRVAISGMAFAFMIGCGKLAVAQSPSQTTLKIDLQNAVEYQAVAGEALSMYVTSLGDRSVIPPQVSVGGMLAEVLYFGAAPGYPGYNQGELPFAGRCAWWTCCPPTTYLSRSSEQ